MGRGIGIKEEFMNYWIFIVKSHGESLSGEEIFNQRMKDCFWGLREKTPNRRSLAEGDKVVFYIGMPLKVFGGTAVLSSASLMLNDSQKKQYGHGTEFYDVDYGVLLKDIEIWQNPKSMEELVASLNFIENKGNWGSYFQGGVRQITEDDFKIIIGEREARIETPEDIKSKAEFALENQLEQFIFDNWHKIGWGSKLELYRTDEQDGRQFPVGDWSIDFLAIDKSTDALVVIELKRGRPSDTVVGQLLRYISLVRENVASRDQKVRGIIVVSEVDDRLRYSTKYLDFIEIKTYKVDFQLSSFTK